MRRLFTQAGSGLIIFGVVTLVAAVEVVLSIRDGDWIGASLFAVTALIGVWAVGRGWRKLLALYP